ncbi:MAG: hypothetical protein L3J82_03390 [Planctomycetes bacterium]|nr:hypothetical protein [Planctomycetota bacterium]
MRWIILLLLTIAAPAVSAATTSFSGSVPNGRTLTYLYEVDLGATATAVTFTATLESLSTAGLIGTVVDIDTFSSSGVFNPTSANEQTIVGTGTINCTVNNTYSGVRCFALVIETASGTTSTSFNVTITTTTTTVTEIDFTQIISGATGLKIAVEQFAQSYYPVSAGQTIPIGVELDFGATSQTVFIRFEASGNNLDRIELIDTTGGSATILQTFTGPFIDGVAAIPLTHSGIAYMRVNVVGQGGTAGNSFWRLTFPCGIKASIVGVNEDNDGDAESGCVTGDGRHDLIMLGLIALLAAVYTRRKLGCRKCVGCSGRTCLQHGHQRPDA